MSNPDDFGEQMELLAGLTRPLLLVDVEPLRDVVGQAEALAPVLDPTAYRNGGAARLLQQRRFLDALAEFQDAVRAAVPQPNGGEG